MLCINDDDQVAVLCPAASPVFAAAVVELSEPLPMGPTTGAAARRPGPVMDPGEPMGNPWETHGKSKLHMRENMDEKHLKIR